MVTLFRYVAHGRAELLNQIESGGVVHIFIITGRVGWCGRSCSRPR
jgi:hypothetical protein